MLSYKHAFNDERLKNEGESFKMDGLYIENNKQNENQKQKQKKQTAEHPTDILLKMVSHS